MSAFIQLELCWLPLKALKLCRTLNHCLGNAGSLRSSCHRHGKPQVRIWRLINNGFSADARMKTGSPKGVPVCLQPGLKWFGIVFFFWFSTLMSASLKILYHHHLVTWTVYGSTCDPSICRHDWFFFVSFVVSRSPRELF